MPGQAAGAILRKGLLERPQEDVSEPPYLLAVLIQEGCLPGHRLHASHECLHRRACALEVSPPLHRTSGVRNRQARCRRAELSTKETKQLQALQKQLDECREYHERLQVVAEQAISFDLDDGVVVNYAKFGNILQKIK